MFWIICILMILMVAALLARAAARGVTDAREAAAFDLAVYRDQLAEVDRDLTRGVLDAEEAERVRVEISRRILEADRALDSEGTDQASPRVAKTKALSLAMGVVLLAGTLATYVWLGAPGYPDLPIDARIAAAEERRADRPSQELAEAQAVLPPPAAPPTDLVEPIAQLRELIATRPTDIEGHRLLARFEAQLGNYQVARAAQERLVLLLGNTATAEDHARLGGLMVLAAGGYVSPEAEASLDTALTLDPTNGPARYYKGLLEDQIGRPDLAFAVWRELLETSPPGAPWAQTIQQDITALARDAGFPRYTPPAQRGPTTEDLRAAQDMSPEDRREMISGMVEGLADRLATEGGTVEDWARLIASLGILGAEDRAAAIYSEALVLFSDNDRAMDVLRDVGARAGLSE